MKNKKDKQSIEKVRRFPKFYVLDIVVVLLIVAIFLGIFFRYSVSDLFANAKEQIPAEISFSVKNINSSSIDYVKIGDEVYFKDSGEGLGTIMASTENSKRPLREVPASESVYIESEAKFNPLHHSNLIFFSGYFSSQ